MSSDAPKFGFAGLDMRSFIVISSVAILLVVSAVVNIYLSIEKSNLIAALEDEQQVNSKSKGELKKNVTELEEQISTLERDRVCLESRIKGNGKVVEDLIHQRDALRDKYDKQAETFERSKLEKDSVTLQQNKLFQLETENKSFNERIKAVENEVNPLKKRNQQLKIENELLLDDLSKRKTAIDQLEQRIRGLNSGLKEMQEEKLTLLERIRSETKRNDDQLTRILDGLVKIEEKERDLAAANKEIVRLLSQIETSNDNEAKEQSALKRQHESEINSLKELIEKTSTDQGIQSIISEHQQVKADLEKLTELYIANSRARECMKVIICGVCTLNVSHLPTSFCPYCKKVFCTNCIEEWCKKPGGSSCPNCRSSLKDYLSSPIKLQRQLIYSCSSEDCKNPIQNLSAEEGIFTPKCRCGLPFCKDCYLRLEKCPGCDTLVSPSKNDSLKFEIV